MPMTQSGNISKMKVLHENEVQYFLSLSDNEIHLNPFIGKKIELVFEGQINCISCGVKTKKSFNQGFCYKCFIAAPESSPCIVNPELCEAHLGKGRDVEWEERNHNQPHVVYLAKASGIKVGVTRSTQIPTRWIDQGASEAIILAELPYRRLAGEIEVELKNYFSDKTNWQQMLKNQISPIDLQESKETCIRHYLPEIYYDFISDNDSLFSINYPVLEYPKTVKSISFDTKPVVQSVLMGIKGQYLFFEGGEVLNIRKHGGYLASFHA
jgi:hypothetical protein